MDQICRQIVQLSRQYQADKIVLFGSRARGDHRENSDIDIAVFGMPTENQALFWDSVNELPTLLEFDIVFLSPKTDEKLVRNIKKDGVILMDKFAEKYEKLQSAIERLRESIDDYEKTNMDSVRDGVIQRFEFCTELTWKTLREYLLEQGYTEINSPKSVMRKAYADGLMKDDTMWIQLLNDRNLTSHLYDETTAQEIYQRIKEQYYPMFQNMLGILKN